METADKIWTDGEFVDWEDATVHFLTHALHYGTAVFEGIRAYSTPEGTAVFRHREHMDRLAMSAHAYGIPMKYTIEQLEETNRELLRVNDLDSAYIRPLVFFGEGGIGINTAKNEVRTFIAAFPWGAYLGEEGIKNGITATVSSWRRINHNSFIPTAKGSGGYLNSVLAKSEATRNGYDEAIMLNDSGSVSEGSGMNLFAIYGEKIITPQVSSGILEGITRNSVVELLESEGIEIQQTELARGSLYAADEIFITGTAAEVTPIREIDGRAVGTGQPGPITRKAQELFGDAVAGKLSEFSHWLDYI
jgi:branched-chain amino acid aminotransferase